MFKRSTLIASAAAILLGATTLSASAVTLRYANGKETDWMVIAFAPRAKSIALYLGPLKEHYPKLKDQLGKHSGGGTSCLHVKHLADVHVPTLEKLIVAAAKEMSREPVRPARC